MNGKKRSKTQILVEGALMIAMAIALNEVKLFTMPQGGSISLQMIPIILMGVRNGSKWGCFTGFICGLLELVSGFAYVLAVGDSLIARIGCILLDYLLAQTVLGLAGFFVDHASNKLVGVGIGTAVCGALAFVCSFLSGWWLWGSYAWEGWNPCLYSLVYNISYMLPNTIIAVIVMVALHKLAPKLFKA